MSNPATKEPEEKREPITPAGEAKKWTEVIKDLGNNIMGPKGAFFLLVLLVAGFVYNTYNTGDSHQITRGDQAWAETNRILQQQHREDTAKIRELEIANRQLMNDNKMKDDANGESAIKQDRLLNTIEIINQKLKMCETQKPKK